MDCVRTIKRSSVVLESAHPYAPASIVEHEVVVPDSARLVVMWDDRTNLEGGGSMSFFGNRARTRLVARITGGRLQCAPLTIEGNRVYARFHSKNENVGGSWGYRCVVSGVPGAFSPTCTALTALPWTERLSAASCAAAVRALSSVALDDALPGVVREEAFRALLDIVSIVSAPGAPESLARVLSDDTLAQMTSQLEAMLGQLGKSLPSRVLQLLAEVVVRPILAPSRGVVASRSPGAVQRAGEHASPPAAEDAVSEPALKRLQAEVEEVDWQTLGTMSLGRKVQLAAAATAALVHGHPMPQLITAAAFHLTCQPLSKMSLVHQGNPTAPFAAAIADLFELLDTRNSGALAWPDVARVESLVAGKAVSADAAQSRCEAFHRNESGELTQQGLTERMMALASSADAPAAIWRVLEALGVAHHFGQQASFGSLRDALRAGRTVCMWDHHVQSELVKMVNAISDRLQHSPCELHSAWMVPQSAARYHCHTLVSLDAREFQLRFAELRVYNQLLQSVLPLVDAALMDREGSFCSLLGRLRHLVFTQLKVGVLARVLSATATQKDPPAAMLDRIGHKLGAQTTALPVSRSVASRGVQSLPSSRLLNSVSSLATPSAASGGGSAVAAGASGAPGQQQSVAAKREAERNATLFMQLYRQLSSVPAPMMRHDGRCFRVQFRNESAEGEAGPYREAITSICAELQSDELGLLIPSVNAAQSKQQVGIGEQRHKFVLNPAATSAQDLALFEFLGRLMAIAVRSHNPLALDLPSVLWKRVVGNEPDVHDLRDVDTFFVQSMESLASMSEEDFEDSMEALTWSVVRTDRKVVALVPGGEEKRVTYDDRVQYAAAAIAARLAESEAQTRAVLRGFNSLVPLLALRLFTWREMEVVVCGHPVLDVALLRRYTVYRNLDPSEPRVRFLWQVLEEFSAEERALFLRFVWGRLRLPPEAELQRENMKIFPDNDGAPDRTLPHSETCFFSLKLPRYTTKAALKDRLLYAIIHTRTMDADVEDVFQGPGAMHRGGGSRGGFGGGRGGFGLFR